MKQMRAHVLWIPLTAALAIGCSKENATSESPSTAPSSVAASATASAPVASASASAAAPAPSASAANPANERRAGLAGMFVRTARQLPLSETQTASLDKVLEPFAGDNEMQTAMKQAHEDMIAGIKAGKIDDAKLNGDYAAVEKAMAARNDKEETALNSVHKLLDPTQRKALVAKMRDKQKERDDRMAQMKAKMGGDAGAADWSKKRLDRMTRDLDLDADQQKKVGALIAKDAPQQATMDARSAAMKKRMDALLTAFEKDDFDAKKVDTTPPAKDARAEMQKHAQFFSQLLPILKPAQRDKLASTMSHPPMMGGMGGHGEGAPSGDWHFGEAEPDNAMTAPNAP